MAQNRCLLSIFAANYSKSISCFDQRISQRKNGAIGIDLNVNNIAWAYCDSEGNLLRHGQINIDLAVRPPKGFSSSFKSGNPPNGLLHRADERSRNAFEVSSKDASRLSKGTRTKREGKSSGQATHILSQAIGQIIDIAVDNECPIVIEKLDFSGKKSRLREHGKRYAQMLSNFAYSKFSDLIHSKARLSCIQVIETNPAYSSLMGMTKYMSLYGLNSGTSSALVLARRSLRLSERLPRACNALISPVDDNKHVWSYWARISKLLKGCHRHSYFEMKVRVGVGGNAAVSAAYSTPTRRVKPNNQNSVSKRKLLSSRTELIVYFHMKF